MHHEGKSGQHLCQPTADENIALHCIASIKPLQDDMTVAGMCIADAKLAELEPLGIADAFEMLVDTYSKSAFMFWLL